jgi:endonuclease III
MNKLRARKILSVLEERYPNPKILLTYSNNFELLVSVMLSAQTTDAQVNKITPSLFKKYQGKNEPEEISNFANADINKLEKDISSIGLFRSKAKNIKAASQIILKKFKGKIPKTMDEMLILPGVGRKTANVVLWNGYGIIEGIAVDTHVKKQAKNLGFTKNEDPAKIEKDLMALFSKKDWPLVTYLLISYGRDMRKNRENALFLD